MESVEVRIEYFENITYSLIQPKYDADVSELREVVI
jgi:hypothetical protein